jgi:hypothetical protein
MSQATHISTILHAKQSGIQAISMSLVPDLGIGFKFPFLGGAAASTKRNKKGGEFMR